jgi:hypothetical protein
MQGAFQHAFDPEPFYAVSQQQQITPFLGFGGRELIIDPDIAGSREDVMLAGYRLANLWASHCTSITGAGLMIVFRRCGCRQYPKKCSGFL